ncbi:MAG: MBL fold metallo-hydrolase [Coriobacteriaceae bacterium]|nr:MBL fold metallo-hydrolase [Coriobacteriaceae bacterium]
MSIPIVSGRRDPLVKVAPHIFRIDLPVTEVLPTTNSYIVIGPERSLLIDAGLNIPESKDALDLALSKLNVSWRDVDVFLTHSDLDHAAGLTQIARQTMRVYSGMTDFRQRSIPIMRGEVFVGIVERICRDHDTPFSFDRDWWAPMRDRGTDDILVTTVREGDTLDVGDYHFEVIATPGHEPSHLCLFDEASGVFVAGDHVIGDSYPSVVLSSDTDELGLYLDSLKKVRDYPARLVLTGHGEEFTDLAGRVDQILGHYERQLANMREILDTGITDVAEIVYATTCRPRRKPWGERPLFGQMALVGATMTYLKHLVATGEYPDQYDIVHK